jgi:hypothetical protein
VLFTSCFLFDFVFDSEPHFGFIHDFLISTEAVQMQMQRQRIPAIHSHLHAVQFPTHFARSSSDAISAPDRSRKFAAVKDIPKISQATKHAAIPPVDALGANESIRVDSDLGNLVNHIAGSVYESPLHSEIEQHLISALKAERVVFSLPQNQRFFHTGQIWLGIARTRRNFCVLRIPITIGLFLVFTMSKYAKQIPEFL